jgi:iron complex outermembrane receptor protein
VPLRTRAFRVAVSAAVLTFLAFVGPQIAIANPKSFDIGPLDATRSLLEFGRQSSLQILFASDKVKGFVTNAVHGAYEPLDAIHLMLNGTGLSVSERTTGVLVVEPEKITKHTSSEVTGNLDGVGRELALAQAVSAPTSDRSVLADTQNGPGRGPSDAGDNDKTKLDEIVVTGTHIRGEGPVGSSLKVYTHEDIVESGAGSIDQFARQMVENFSAIDAVSNAQSSVVQSRFGIAAANNGYQGASFDLHGLGPSATLTLVNGHRIAQGGDDGSIADISQIPLSAVDHIEVLGDGASAIYGADAVAGVVNIVTRKDFDGAETAIRYGTATSGGAAQFTGSQLVGKSWSGGNAFLNYEFDRQSGLDASDRSYIPNQNGPDTLIPKNRRNSLYFSGNQNLGSDTRIAADAFYSDRKFFTATDVSSAILNDESSDSGSAKTYGVTLSVNHDLFRDWVLDLTGSYSKQEQFFDEEGSVVFGPFSQVSSFLDSTNTDVGSADLLASGSLFKLPGGPVKAAIGASYRREEFDTFTFETLNGGSTPLTSPTLKRHVSSAYGEFFVPIVGASNATAWAKSLQFSVAARYDDYSDFGSTTNPKVGLSWEPVAGIALRGSYGRSFRAPLLNQIGEPVLSIADPVPNPTSPTRVTDTVIINGGNPSLKPEKSTSYTAGFDLKPDLLPNFKLAATYYHIDFRDRISTPPVFAGNYFNDPAIASFLTLNPPLSLVQSYFNSPGFQGDNFGAGAAGVGAIFDQRQANIAKSITSGIDLTVSYELPTSIGHFGFNSAVERALQNKFQPLANQPSIELVNTFGEPTRWKARGTVSWHQAGLSVTLTGNYVSNYENDLFTPEQPVASWTTGDVFLGYTTGVTPTQYWLQKLTISFSVLNFTNREPPFLAIPSVLPGQMAIPYDPANASPVRRLVALQVVKRW